MSELLLAQRFARASAHPAQADDVEGRLCPHPKDVEPGCMARLHRAGRVEDVVVDRTAGQVLAAALLERRSARRAGVPLDVVQLKHLVEVGEIVLADRVCLIGTHVLHGRDRPAVIEGLVAMGEDEQQVAPVAYRPLPFGQCPKWVGQVLQHVRGEHGVVVVVGDRVEPTRLADDAPSRLDADLVTGPECLIGVVERVEGREPGVDGADAQAAEQRARGLMWVEGGWETGE